MKEHLEAVAQSGRPLQQDDLDLPMNIGMPIPPLSQQTNEPATALGRQSTSTSRHPPPEDEEPLIEGDFEPGRAASLKDHNMYELGQAMLVHNLEPTNRGEPVVAKGYVFSERPSFKEPLRECKHVDTYLRWQRAHCPFYAAVRNKADHEIARFPPEKQAQLPVPGDGIQGPSGNPMIVPAYRKLEGENPVHEHYYRRRDNVFDQISGAEDAQKENVSSLGKDSSVDAVAQAHKVSISLL